MNKTAALLVIDIQHGFMRKGAEEILPQVSDLARKWTPDRVFYLKYRNYPGSLFTRLLDWHSCMTSPETDIVPEVYVPGAPVFDHYGYRPPDDLIAALRAYKQVAICGVDTDACVMAAVFALWDAEIEPIVLARYCASSGGPHFHHSALDLMLRQFGSGIVWRDAVA